MIDKPKQRHTFRADLLAYVRSFPYTPGELYHVSVLHDPWCAAFQPGGVCNCHPEIRSGTPGHDR